MTILFGNGSHALQRQKRTLFLENTLQSIDTDEKKTITIAEPIFPSISCIFESFKRGYR